MAHPPSPATPERRPSSPRPPSPSRSPAPPSPAVFGPEDFPGCEPFHLPASEIERYEGRLEFWDARTETAWKVCEPTTIHHERPARLLARVVERFAQLRGSRIECFGSADLLCRDERGGKLWLMQADEVLYLHPERSQPPGPSIEVVSGPLPEVVLEVDYTTDVRRRKLSIYQASGFPEIWVLVPPRSPMGWPGVRIFVRDGDGYRSVPESAAFPGWTAREIYAALTENPPSDWARQALERVALAMGAREGTSPEDDPHSHALIQRGRAAMVRALLQSRGIEVSAKLAEDGPALVAGLSAEALTEAALACTGEADFLHRIRDEPATFTAKGPLG